MLCGNIFISPQESVELIIYLHYVSLSSSYAQKMTYIWIINSRIQIKKKKTEWEAIDSGVLVLWLRSPRHPEVCWQCGGHTEEAVRGCTGISTVAALDPFHFLAEDWGVSSRVWSLPGCVPTSLCPCPQPSSEELQVLSARSAAIPSVLSIWYLYLDYLCSSDSSSLRCNWATFSTAFPAPCPQDKYWSAVSLSSINISRNFPLIPASTHYSPLILSTTSSLHWIHHWVVPIPFPKCLGV